MKKYKDMKISELKEGDLFFWPIDVYIKYPCCIFLGKVQEKKYDNQPNPFAFVYYNIAIQKVQKTYSFYTGHQVSLIRSYEEG